jgi:hypothetical protein
MRKVKGYMALSDLKTLDKLAKQAEAYKKKGLKLRDTEVDLQLKFSDMTKKKEAEKKKWDTMKTNYEKTIQDQKQKVFNARKAMEAAEDKHTTAEMEEFDSLKLMRDAERAMEAYEKEGQAKEKSFKTQIDSFATAAKALGLKVDVKKYKSAAELYTFY